MYLKSLKFLYNNLSIKILKDVNYCLVHVHQLIDVTLSTNVDPHNLMNVYHVNYVY